MMVGTLTEENEFRFSLTLRNSEQEEIEVEAVLDTGFTGQLVLPRDVINRLELAQEDYEEVSLGDGSVTQFSVHEVTVIWDDEERVVTALGADGDVLIGVQLMRGSVTLLEAVDGGVVTIEGSG